MSAEPNEAGSQQLPLSATWIVAARRAADAEQRRTAVLCAGCREREARYGFRPEDDEDPALERPRTLCFACF